jgi:hypothetical protein
VWPSAGGGVLPLDPPPSLSASRMCPVLVPFRAGSARQGIRRDSQLKARQSNACLAGEGKAASAARIAQRLLHRRLPIVRPSDFGMEESRGVAHGHVSRQGPPLRPRPARPAGARLLPGAVAETRPGSRLPPAAGALRRRRRPAGAAPGRHLIVRSAPSPRVSTRRLGAPLALGQRPPRPEADQWRSERSAQWLDAHPDR